MAIRPRATVSGIRTRAGLRLAIVLALGLVLTGCAEAADDPGALPSVSDPASNPAGACLEGATECADVPGGDLPGPLEGMEPRLVEPHEDLVDVRAVPWVEVQPNDDQTVLTVSWWGGNEACYGLDHVEVDETDEAVTVTVHTGRNPEAEACTEEAILKATTVELSAELGPRSILDGAAS